MGLGVKCLRTPNNLRAAARNMGLGSWIGRGVKKFFHPIIAQPIFGFIQLTLSSYHYEATIIRRLPSTQPWSKNPQWQIWKISLMPTLRSEYPRKTPIISHHIPSYPIISHHIPSHPLISPHIRATYDIRHAKCEMRNAKYPYRASRVGMHGVGAWARKLSQHLSFF